MACKGGVEGQGYQKSPKISFIWFGYTCPLVRDFSVIYSRLSNSYNHHRDYKWCIEDERASLFDYLDLLLGLYNIAALYYRNSLLCLKIN